MMLALAASMLLLTSSVMTKASEDDESSQNVIGIHNGRELYRYRPHKGKKDRHGKKSQSKGKSKSKSKSKSSNKRGGTRHVCLEQGLIIDAIGAKTVTDPKEGRGSQCDLTEMPPLCTPDSLVGNDQLLINSSSATDTMKFQFTKDQKTIGDGSLKFSIECNDPTGSSTCADDKGTIRYFYPNVSSGAHTPASAAKVKHFNYICYDYRAESCGIIPRALCSQQFYINLYTINPGSSCTYYDCSFDYYPQPPGTFELNQWYTNCINLDTTPFQVSPGTAPGCSCPVPTPQSLNNAIAASLLSPDSTIGSPWGLGFVINMGNDSALDNQMIGYFDNIRFSTVDKTTKTGVTEIFDLEPNHYSFLH